MASELLRVTHVSIKSLFDIYDHEFSLDFEDRITILHGPNGVGKTILLKCISALFNGHYAFLARTPFRSFSVTLSDKSQITILREKAEPRQNQRRVGREEQPAYELTAEIRTGGTKQSLAIKQVADVAQLARVIEQESPFILQVDESRWFERRTNQVY